MTSLSITEPAASKRWAAETVHWFDQATWEDDHVAFTTQASGSGCSSLCYSTSVLYHPIIASRRAQSCFSGDCRS